MYFIFPDIYVAYCELDAPENILSVVHPFTVAEDLQARGFTW